MNKDYKIENSIKITDWMLKSDLIPLGDNFDKLLKGFIETPGRMVQPSFNFYVIIPYNIIMYIDIIHWLGLYIYLFFIYF